MKALMKYLRWIWSHSKGVRGAIALNIVLETVSIGLSLLFIFFCKKLVDIATGAAEGELVTGAVLTIVTVVLRLLVNAFNVKLENLTSFRMNFIIRSKVYSDLLAARWFGRERIHTGDTLNRLETDVSTVTNVICSDVPSFVTTVIQLVAAVAFLSFMDWRLAVALVAITPLFAAAGKLFFRRLRSLTRKIRESESKVQSHLQESIQHRVMIRSLENTSMMESKLDELQGVEYGQVQERTRFNVWARTAVSAAFVFGYLAAFLWGVRGIWLGTITFGTMTAFLQLVGQVQRPVVNLTRQIPGFIYATASIDRIAELEESPKENVGEPVLLKGPAGVRVEHLTFSYPDGHRKVLDGLDFDFPPLSRTAIVGETGVGKSTLIRLMLALLQPDEGSIKLYGPSTEVEVSPSTRRNLVYVPQGNSLLSGTIRDNLKMGDPDATEARMHKALEIAEALFVEDLPDGLDTLCGEGGAGLSEGQAQRIAIARGLLRPGCILLLDEFSSSLDPGTEARLMENLARNSEGKTIIFITHRERITRYCDRILRLED